MSLPNPEVPQSTPEQVSTLQLAEACRKEAESSYKFRTMQNRKSGLKIPVTDESGTDYRVGFMAEHELDQDSGEPVGQNYTLSLSVTHMLTDIPGELRDMMGVSEEEAAVIVIFGVEAKYDIDLYLSDDGDLEWAESRHYELIVDDPNMTADEIDAGLAEFGIEATSSESESSGDELEDEEGIEDSIRVHYHVPLGSNFFAEDPKVRQLHKDFESIMGHAGLMSFETSSYAQKAAEILEKYKMGRDADYDAEKYFPEDIVQSIKSQHTR